ncbi:MAG: hypothetical protein E4H13_13145 [Calditrichales bacterium]|nr:MAG: hypothetical protein E4H13_13145 [Calditrichales bacterium]
MVISVFNPEIKYSEPFEKTFFGRNFVKRQITVEVSGQIYSPLTSVVSQTINKSPRVVDEIAQGSIEDLERSAYRFTQGIKAGYSFWEKFYEPALAVTSVALIVYLFFTQRT